MAFPSSPTTGQVASVNGRQYTYDGYAWGLSSNVAGHASTHASGGSDAVTIASSQVTGLAAVATSGSAADLSTGTLADARLSANVITSTTLAASQSVTTGSCEVYPRYVAGNVQTPTSASVYWSFFSPPYSFTASQISIATSAASATITAAKLGLYTVDANGAVTLVARTASDNTIFSTASSVATRSFSTTGGYPATYALSAGSRYALAFFATASSSMPSVPAIGANSSAAWASPRIHGYMTSQSDLPTSVASNGYATSAHNFMFWMKIS